MKHGKERSLPAWPSAAAAALLNVCHAHRGKNAQAANTSRATTCQVFGHMPLACTKQRKSNLWAQRMGFVHFRECTPALCLTKYPDIGPLSAIWKQCTPQRFAQQHTMAALGREQNDDDIHSAPAVLLLRIQLKARIPFAGSAPRRPLTRVRSSRSCSTSTRRTRSSSSCSRTRCGTCASRSRT